MNQNYYKMLYVKISKKKKKSLVVTVTLCISMLVYYLIILLNIKIYLNKFGIQTTLTVIVWKKKILMSL